MWVDHAGSLTGPGMIRVSSVLSLLYPDGMDYIEQGDLDRGTRLHFALEVYCNNLIGGYPHMAFRESEILTRQDIRRIEAVARWIDEQQFVPLSAEEKYIDPALAYVGHPDCVGYKFNPRGSRASNRRMDLTLDWKFAESITTANLIQVEAYRKLVGNPVWLVQCDREAKVKVHKCKPRPDLWAIFLSGLNVLKFQQQGRGEYHGNLLSV